MKLTTIVIDDSALQQLATCKLVNSNPNLKLLASYRDPIIGIEAVKRFRPDVLFLDVEMNELNGFEVLEHIEDDCQVILNSTQSQFALRAFQYSQVKDYLTKPMARPRFEKSIDRVMTNQLRMNKEESAVHHYIWINDMAKVS